MKKKRTGKNSPWGIHKQGLQILANALGNKAVLRDKKHKIVKPEKKYEEIATTHYAQSINYKMGFKQEWERGEVDYWYEPDTYVKLKKIDINRDSPKSIYYRLMDRQVPLRVDKETHEVTIDYGILNLMIN